MLGRHHLFIYMKYIQSSNRSFVHFIRSARLSTSIYLFVVCFAFNGMYTNRFQLHEIQFKTLFIFILSFNLIMLKLLLYSCFRLQIISLIKTNFVSWRFLCVTNTFRSSLAIRLNEIERVCKLV